MLFQSRQQRISDQVGRVLRIAPGFPTFLPALEATAQMEPEALRRYARAVAEDLILESTEDGAMLRLSQDQLETAAFVALCMNVLHGQSSATRDATEWKEEDTSLLFRELCADVIDLTHLE